MKQTNNIGVQLHFSNSKEKYEIYHYNYLKCVFGEKLKK